MGTKPNQKMSNDITISRSNINKTVDPTTGKSVNAEQSPDGACDSVPSRSFAQPSPVAPVKDLKPKSHASKVDEDEALKRNSTKNTETKTETSTEVDTDVQDA